MKSPRKGTGKMVKYYASWNKHLNKEEAREFWKKFRLHEKEETTKQEHEVLEWWQYQDGDCPEEDFDQLIYESEWEDYNYDLIERIGDLIKYKK